MNKERNMCTKRKTQILVECPELIASVRVGVLEPLRPLIEKEIVEVVFKRTIDINKNDIAWCDILICVRGCEYITLEVIKSAKRSGRLIIYFLDDDLLNVPEELTCFEYFNDSYIKKYIKEIISLSDIFWSINSKIEQKYKKYCTKKTFLNNVPTKYIEAVAEEKNKKVKILYAGSESHTSLIQKYLREVILKINSEYKDKIDVTFIGANPNIYNIPNIHYYKLFEDYDQYKEFVLNGNFDIGLAIIENSDFYQCKYFNKFIEYTSIGCVGIYTNSKPYTDIVMDKENGLLCKNTFEDWYKCITYLIENEEQRQQYLNCAIKKINKDFSYEVIAKKIYKELPEIISFRAKKISPNQIKMIRSTRIKFIFERIKYLWRIYKLASIPIIFYKIIKKIIKKINKLIKRIK